MYLFVISDMDVVNACAFARAMDGSKYSILLLDNYGARGEIPEGFFLGTELPLRRSCCCDGAVPATELRSTSSVALILRVASLGRHAQNDETSIHFPPC